MTMMISQRSKQPQQHAVSLRAFLMVVTVAVLPFFATAWAPPQQSQRMTSIQTFQQQQHFHAASAFKVATSLAMTTSEASDDNSADQEGGDDSSPLQEALNQEEPQQQQRAPSPPRPPQPRRLDPLIASLTRMDDATRNAPTVKAPIFGEIPLDGSLVVLVPTTLIAVAGFVMSIYIALNSPDAIVESLNAVNKEIVNAASQGAPQILAPDANGCRGLCSSQDQDLEGLRIFMNNLAGK